MDSFNKLLDQLISQIDIDVVLAVQAATAVVKNTLNLWQRTRGIYTDWAMPFVAVLVGMAFGVARDGLTLEAVLYGVTLAGGAIFFQTLYDKSLIGVALLRGKGKDNPVTVAKLEKSTAAADKRIEAMKTLLKTHAPPPENP